MNPYGYGTLPSVGEPPEIIGRPPDRTCAVTVLVRTYNHQDFVRSCLDGIVNQRFSQRFRVVVRDDASTDATPQIVREYAKSHPELFHVILERENQFSRGNGQFIPRVDELVTPYVALCEGDDRWTDETKLERQWRFMQRNPWCALSHHDVEIEAVESAIGYATELRRYLHTYRPARERTSGLELVTGNWIMTCSVMMRTAAIPRPVVALMAGREPSDYIAFILVTQCGDIGFLPDVMASYRLHGSNFWWTMSDVERTAREIDALWFLAAHLSGASLQRVRERLLEVLAAQPDAVAFTPFVRMRERDRGLVHDRDVLLDRVRYLEEREIELVHALGWDAGDQ